MSQLGVIYQEHRRDLQARIDQATTSEEIISVIQAELSTIETEYRKGLSVPQLRVALPMLEALRQSLDASKTILSVQSVPAPTEKSPSIKFFGYLDELIEALLRPNANSRRRERSAESVRVDSGAYLDRLGRALGAIEQAVAEVKPPTPPEPIPNGTLTPEAHRVLLEFLQDLAADAQDDDSRAMLKRARQLPRILEDYGIQVEVYQADGQPSGIDPRRLFEFEPSIDPQQREFVTLVPAFIRENRVLLRGRVVEPAREDVAK